MKKSALMILIAFSTTAWADDKQDQRNVYDVFRELLKPSAGTTVDERVTARIKRHMANLLYPVDMSSFAGPDKDAKFRDLIMALQKQLGARATGILTFDQFDRLEEASRDIDAPMVALPPEKYVSMANDNLVIAVGTRAMDHLAELYPINQVNIVCDKPDRSCVYTEARFDLKAQMLFPPDSTTYKITTWTSNRVTAISDDVCNTASMTIDVKAQTVTIVAVFHADLAFCTKKPPNIWTLADGFPVAWKLYQDRINIGRALVYEPARNFFAD
jgi:hypothetical protein